MFYNQVEPFLFLFVQLVKRMLYDTKHEKEFHTSKNRQIYEVIDFNCELHTINEKIISIYYHEHYQQKGYWLNFDVHVGLTQNVVPFFYVHVGLTQNVVAFFYVHVGLTQNIVAFFDVHVGLTQNVVAFFDIHVGLTQNAVTFFYVIEHKGKNLLV